ncbi:MAG: ATP-binding cassette domain-containing protein [Acholeplasmatales bacterium]|jgi:ABC-type lipoprotein export system ATPase subunit/ABC-type antimicrobial peptide transport system permease subunit|nr:ATP-binding cassette domain-containing protein [Acholeplasmatales bacterium]
MIKLVGLEKVYKTKKNQNVEALTNINLELPSKGMVFIIGKSGSGKTTLLNMIGGLDSPTSGLIYVNDKLINSASQSELDSYRNSFLGLIFQDSYLFNHLSVYDNVIISYKLKGSAVDDSYVDKILERVGILDLKNRLIKELSGGQKQRVAIARTLVKDVEIILADEPTGSLDSINSKIVYDLLKEISAYKLVIVVSHDFYNSLSYATRIIELSDGKIIKDLTAKRGATVEDSVAFHDELLSTYFVKNPHRKSSDLKVENEVKATLTNFSITVKERFRMSLSNIFKRKVMVIFTIVLVSIMLMLFGISINMKSFNVVDSIISTTNTEKLGSIGFANTKVGNRQFGKDQVVQALFNYDELRNVDLYFPNLEYYTEFSQYWAFLPTVKAYPLKYNYRIAFHDNLMGFKGGVNEQNLSDFFNSKLLYGTYPKHNDDYIEVIVSDFFAYGAALWGIADSKVVPGSDIRDVIGLDYIVSYTDLPQFREIPYAHYNLRVVGIYQTDFRSRFFGIDEEAVIDIETFSKGIEDAKADSAPYWKNEYFLNIYNNAMCIYEDLEEKAYHNPYNFIRTNLALSDALEEDDSTIWTDYTLGIPNFINYKDFSTTYTMAGIYPDTNEGIRYANGYDSNSELKDDEIIIDYLTMYRLYYEYSPESIVPITFSEFDLSVLDGLLLWTKDHVDGTYELQFKIAGIADNPWGIGFLLVNDYRFFLAKEHAFRSANYVYVKNGDYNDMVALAKEMLSHGYIVGNYISLNVMDIAYLFKLLGTVFTALIILLFLIVTVLLYYFISTNIKNQADEIGLLRALGASGKSIMQVYLIETLIMSVFMASICVGLIYLSTSLINQTVVSIVSYNLVILTTKWFSVVIAVVVCFLSSALASIIPLFKLNKSKPIDTLKTAK